MMMMMDADDGWMDEDDDGWMDGWMKIMDGWMGRNLGNGQWAGNHSAPGGGLGGPPSAVH